MSSSVYDVLYARPKLHKKLHRAAEDLALAIVESGKLRIDAGHEVNFVRLLVPAQQLNMTFTLRELNDPELAKAAQARLQRRLSLRNNPQKAEEFFRQYWDKARADGAKRNPVSAQVELMVARALVLCNALAVMRLLHLEGAEFFISFGQSVGDVMDIARWQEVGDNSGLQAVGGGENAVYVSAGGHPFLEDDERTWTSDGFPALARLMIIAAQETGHNGDMRRNANGEWVGRYSSEGWSRAPSKQAGDGRRADIARTEKLYDCCRSMGLMLLVRWERHLRFYREQKLRNWRRAVSWLLAKLGWQLFKLALRCRNMRGLGKLQRDKYPATLLNTFFPDMLANLTPMADVYRRKNPLEEEAIACIEAVARVPQQVVKWGHDAVRCCTPKLHRFYYTQIVLACAREVKRRLGISVHTLR